MNKKPYIKKYGFISGFNVWIVDGNYIRTNIDIEFTNAGQHYRFKYIPKDEIWIDRKYGEPGEEKYYIDSLVIENKLMSQGKGYDEASDKSDIVEIKERKNSREIKGLLNLKNREEVLNKIKKKLLKKYSGKVKVWVVNGKLVRGFFFIDYTIGGHDKIYSFIPNNEIWIDDDVSKRELKFVLLHEIYERNSMSRGLGYYKWSHYGIETKNFPKNKTYKNEKYNKLKLKDAHIAASKLELYYRKHPEKIDEKIKEEIKKQL